MIPTVVVYSDFNCPFCYALNERLLPLGVADSLSWRGVQHAPHLQTPMVTWAGLLGAELRYEVETVHRLAPCLPISVPPGKPNTTRAIRAVARALDLDPQRAHAFKDELYRAFWRDGADISDAGILDTLAAGVGLPDGLCADLNAPVVMARTAQWQEEWERSRSYAVPVLVRDDGEVLVGLVDAVQLAAFCREFGRVGP